MAAVARGSSPRLHLVQFHRRSPTPSINPRTHIGVKVGKEIVDLTPLLPPRFQHMRTLLTEGKPMVNRLQELVPRAKERLPLSEVQLRAPLYEPSKILCIGLNYRDHVTESKMTVPSEPVVFCKFPNALVGHGEDIVCPSYAAAELDYEVEMVLVVGARGRLIPEAKALEHVVGISVGNDVSARDWQLKRGGGQWSMGKAFDTFAPLGPSILTLDDDLRANLSSLDLKCSLNGKVLQNSNTKHMIFSPAKIVSYLSRVMTLEPGDLIFTGTPPGVGFGRNPPIFMRNGDTVTCELEHVGELTNRVVIQQEQEQQ